MGSALAAPALLPRIALAQKARQPRIAHPDQPLALVLARLLVELFFEAAHDADQIAAAQTIRSDALLAPMRLPQPLRGLQQKVMHVRRHLQVRQRAADLEHLARPSEARL